MTDIKVVDINSAPKRAGLHVLDRLDDCQTLAQSGGIENLVIVAVTLDGTVLSCWANGSYPYTLVGALESLKQDFMAATHGAG